MLVLKFGGTSVANAERVRVAAEIIEAQPAPRAAVVSAASGVTNLLLAALDAAVKDDRVAEQDAVQAILERHADVLSAIPAGSAHDAVASLHDELRSTLDRVRGTGAPDAATSDRIVSIGERAMAVMMAATLESRGTPAVAVMANEVIATDDRHGQAKPDREKTRELAHRRLVPELEQGRTVVMTGFIGGAPDGSITTLGRGGSDYSATLLGAALDATEVQIWTDVPGVLSADPRIVPQARVVPDISFDEAQELAHFGAKVLHPRTIRPAVARDIPVRILSTFAPDQPGTRVSREWSGDRLKAVTAMSGLLLVTVDVPELEDLSGAAAKVFGVLHEDRIDVVLVSQASSRRRMTYLLDCAGNGGCAAVTSRLEEALRDFDATVACTEDVAVVAAVGHGAAEQPRALSRLMRELDKRGIPVLASSQQTSNAALVAAVPADHAQRAVLAIHREFIELPGGGASVARRPRRSRLLRESMQVG